MSVKLRSLAGVVRSLAMYYGRPGRNRALARFYGTLLRPGDLAFDIGAHVGNRTRALRAAGARVVAVEPQDPFARFLELSLPGDVTLIKAAVGPRETQGEMRVSRRHPTVSSLSRTFDSRAGATTGFRHVRWDARQRVPVTTLDALIARHGVPRFIKIDVEGFEAEVLRGLTQPVELIALEYLPAMPDLTEPALDLLGGLGRYRFNIVTGEDSAFEWRDWRGPADVLAWLGTLTPGDGPGDIYARLDAPLPDARP